MTDYKNIFDRQLNDRISQEELPFDSLAWEMMEEKLDGKKKRFAFWKSGKLYLLGLITLLLVTTFIYWPYHYSDSFDNSVSDVTSIKKAKETMRTQPEIKSSDLVSGSLNASSKKVENENTTSKQELFEENTKVNADGKYRDNSYQTNHTSEGKELGLSNNKTNKFLSENKKSHLTKHIQNSNTNSYGITSSSDTKNVKPQTSLVNQNAFDKVIGSSKVDKSAKTNATLSLMSKLPFLTHDLAFLHFNRSLGEGPTLIEIQESITRPKHQINFALGSGFNQVSFGETTRGEIIPTAFSKRETFVSLSYLNRIRRNFGVELGVQAAKSTISLGHYFQKGEHDLMNPRYAQIGVNTNQNDIAIDLFTNVHLFLPLGQRSELDLYTGLYFNMPQSSGNWSSSGSVRFSGDVNLIEAETSGQNGFIDGGRVKLGLNYNFLTNQRNTISVGVSYMQEIIQDVDGMYAMFASQDNVEYAGNFSINGSGLKVQFQYGFGFDAAPWKAGVKKDKIHSNNPWYVGLKYGIKTYVYDEGLSAALISGNPHQYTTFTLGHYINSRFAMEVGIEYSEFLFSTPRELVINNTRFGMQRQSFLTVPLGLKYDLLQTNTLNLYGKAVVSTDFRTRKTSPTSTEIYGYIIDEDKFAANTAIETGVDFKIYKGLQLGLQGKYNYAFNRLATYQYPVTFTENVYEFQNINLRNHYFSWGVELKYMLNQ